MKSVSGKILLYIITVIFISLSALGALSIYVVKNEVNEQYNKQLLAQLEYVKLLMDNSTQEVRNNAQIYNKLFIDELFKLYGSNFSAYGDRLYLGEHLLNGDYKFIDDFERRTKNFVMIFKFDGDDFIRISTTLKNADGSRMIGDKLNRNFTSYKI